jgi:hypothetical protein
MSIPSNAGGLRELGRSLLQEVVTKLLFDLPEDSVVCSRQIPPMACPSMAVLISITSPASATSSQYESVPGAQGTVSAAANSKLNALPSATASVNCRRFNASRSMSNYAYEIQVHSAREHRRWQPTPEATTIRAPNVGNAAVALQRPARVGVLDVVDLDELEITIPLDTVMACCSGWLQAVPCSATATAAVLERMLADVRR